MIFVSFSIFGGFFRIWTGNFRVLTSIRPQKMYW